MSKQLGLHDLPRGSRVYLDCSDGSSFVTYHRPDGLFSYCETEFGATVHLAYGEKFEVYEDGYKLIEAEA